MEHNVMSETMVDFKAPEGGSFRVEQFDEYQIQQAEAEGMVSQVLEAEIPVLISSNS